VGSIVIVLLQIVSWFWRWKNFWKSVNIWWNYKVCKKCCHFLAHPV